MEKGLLIAVSKLSDAVRLFHLYLFMGMYFPVGGILEVRG